MNKFIYILSNEINYSKLICDDAGPGYALSMNWQYVYINQIDILHPGLIYIIDNRISEKECKALSNVFNENENILFLLKIVDPYTENKNNFYYRWLNENKNINNCRIFTVYEPTELTQEIIVSHNKPYYYIPYPYLKEKELPLSNINKRKNRIIISGALNLEVYPYRTTIWQNNTRSIGRLFFFSTLKHPGYAELSFTNFNHNIIRSDFIKYLGKSKFMLLCSSRCKIEFLKYHECAYSGCIPIGIPPNSFPEEIKKLFYYINPLAILNDCIKLLFNWSKNNHIDIIKKYRKFLDEERNPQTLNAQLLNQIQVEDPFYPT